MKIYIGADHRGYNFKKQIIKIVEDLGYGIEDMGIGPGIKAFDYPKIAQKVSKKVAGSKDARGMLVCMSGIGQMMAANKVRGAYAAVCYNVQAAKLSRAHNNANILVLGSMFTQKGDLTKIIRTWLTTPFEGGRHLRRVNQIKKIEKGSKLK